MQNSVVAARYAQAFFDMVKERGVEELHNVCAVLAGFKEAVDSSEELLLLIKNPVLAEEDKKNVVAKVLEKLGANQLSNQFFFLLLEKNRLIYISAIAEQFSTLLDEFEGISRGSLTTAIAMDTKRQDEIKAALEEQTGRKLALSYLVDPKLLGGLVLKVGDIVLDSSISTQLNNFSQTIKRGADAN